MLTQTDAVASEKQRIENEYRRREAELASDLYAPWQPSENFILSERKSAAASMLHAGGKFPVAGDKCLEIGYGKLGWLADLISWGMRETDLHGIELDSKRAQVAQSSLPNADLRIGDATDLPWSDNEFKLIIVSTVFSSILNAEVRQMIAGEITRVLARGGVLLWYDLAVNNPRNLNVKRINAAELKKLFPSLSAEIKSVTLAPPIARSIVPVSQTLAMLLSAVPFLRTHLLGVLQKA